MWYDLLFSVCCLFLCSFFVSVFLCYDMGVSPAINTNNNNNYNERKKTPTVTQLLISNQKFTGENQATRRYCRRPRHICAGVGIPVNGKLLFCDVANHLIIN